jgi:hypothetical protein
MAPQTGGTGDPRNSCQTRLAEFLCSCGLNLLYPRLERAMAFRAHAVGHAHCASVDQDEFRQG